MNLQQAEIDANFDRFSTDWHKDMLDVCVSLRKDRATYRESYGRITSLQAWRQHIETRVSEESLAFFLEAQNDALTSHIFASLGSWRSALKALRGCIDNILFCVYYKDHPVELQLWKSGNHKLSFSDFFMYIESHPALTSVPQIDCVVKLRSEYSTLSRAVHASAKSFRMTNDVKETLLWSDATSQRGKWQTRERSVITEINILMICLYRDTIAGAAAPGLRDAISLAVPASRMPLVRSALNVALCKPRVGSLP